MNKKRVLSLLLALVMVFGAFAPAVSMAAPDKDVTHYVKLTEGVDGKDKDKPLANQAVASLTVKEIDKNDSKTVVNETTFENLTTDENGVLELKFKAEDDSNLWDLVFDIESRDPYTFRTDVVNTGTDANNPVVVPYSGAVQGAGAGQDDQATDPTVDEIFFQLVNQNGAVVSSVGKKDANGQEISQGTTLVNVTKAIHFETKANFTTLTDVKVEYQPEAQGIVEAYRQYRLYRQDSTGAELPFEDGRYVVTLESIADDVVVEDVLEFIVKDGVLYEADGKTEVKEGARLDVPVTEEGFNYVVNAIGCEFDGIAGKKFEVYRIARTAEGKYQFKDGFPVETGNVLATIVTNEDGHGGFNYEVNNKGEVLIGNNKVAVGELLVVKEVRNDKVVNSQVLNLWKLKDEKKYAGTPAEVILEEPILYLEARADQFNNFVFCADENITLRVRVETKPFTGSKKAPVVGAEVEVGLPKAYAYGAPVEFGKVVAKGTTDKYGYVEFSLPKEEAVVVWNAVTSGTLTSQNMVTMALPYLVRQTSVGDNEGVQLNENIYVVQDAAYLVNTPNGRVYEMTIVDNVDLANRLGGANRYETAVKMAERLFPNGLQVKDNYKNVVIASGDSYPDALTATTTAYNYNAPLLLTQKGQLPKDTAEYLKKVNPSRIVIVGGTQTINEAVEKELEAFGKIKRISGLNRYGTSVENAKDLLRWIMDNNETKWVHGHFGDKGIVYLASGENFPDALAAASPAAVAGSPLLLTMKNQLPKEVKDFIIANKAKEVRVIGGTGSVSDAVIRELRDSNLTANRIAGLDRSATSVEIAKEFYPNANHVFVTSGAGYADALTGATLAAKEGSPVLLLPNADTVSDAVKAYLETYDVTSFTILGGTGTVSEKARTEINNIILGR